MESHLDDAGFGGNFLIVQSTGGLFDVGDARRSCIRMLEPGPAAGVVATKALCDTLSVRNALACHMGGTTAKAVVIYEGNVLMTGAALIGCYATGLPVPMPMIHLQRSARGSIACRVSRVSAERRRLTRPGLLRPRHQADHRGANLILGRLGARPFLGVKWAISTRRKRP